MIRYELPSGLAAIEVFGLFSGDMEFHYPQSRPQLETALREALLELARLKSSDHNCA